MSRGAVSAVVVMAKQPLPGQTKTRLVPPLTEEGAAELAERFLLDALDLAREVDAVPLVAIWPPESERYFAGLAPDIGRVAQVGERLDERLDHVLCDCLESGFERVVAINADSPTLPASAVGGALEALRRSEVDVVVGPAEDGGYYLIGWQRPWPALVRGIEMSTPSVLTDTLAQADRVGARVELLDEWYDVDGPDDLARLREDLATGGRAPHTAALLAENDGARA